LPGERSTGLIAQALLLLKPLARSGAPGFACRNESEDAMDELRIGAKGISVAIDLAVGHLSAMGIEAESRRLVPLHRAPWIEEPFEDLPQGLPDGVARLSGDFLCAPFSVSDVEEAPLHGWSANSPWDVAESASIDGGWRARLRLRRKIMGAEVDKVLTLRDGHPFLYQEHIFTGGSGALPVAHHAMTVMAAGGRLSFSPKRLAATSGDPLEPDPARGRYLLAYPARTDDLHHFPAAAGGTVDLAEYRMDRRHEDFVVLLEADHDGPGWTAVAREAEADLVLVLKDPRALPVTMLWISNGGRDYAPWSGRHRGVLGIEDGRTAVGHAASLGDNWLKREGVATGFELGGRVAFRQVIGAVPLAGGEPPRAVTAQADHLRLDMPDGSVRQIPFDGAFLRN
jgi:hypothetical protein